MKKSIRIKLTAVVLGMIVLSIVLCLLLNIIFLGSFYKENRKDDLYKSYKQISSIVLEMDTDSDEISEDAAKDLTTICDVYDISLLITDESVTSQYAYGDSYGNMKLRLKELIIYLSADDDVNTGSIYRNVRKITDSDSVYVFSMVTDNFTGLDYYEIAAILDNNRFILVRIALENIESFTYTANVLYAFCGGLVILISIFVVSLVSYRIVYKLIKLVTISKSMAALDFSVKYDDFSDNDEIDLLGKNLNMLSNQLESTISELKDANASLRQDLVKKEQLEEKRKEFMSAASHELKTPLAIIQGYAEGLKEGVNDDPESCEFYCDVIINEAQKMNKLVKQMLTLNQMESGGLKLDYENFDINEIINGRLMASASLIENADCTVIFNHEEPVYIWGDSFKIEEVVTNYITNAFNHVKGDGKENRIVKISVIKTDNNKVRVTVYNSGDNIPDSEISKIWEKFYKVDKARTREYGGSGIGLSIVKAIMDAHNNSYGVENVDGGVCFYFEADTK